MSLIEPLHLLGKRSIAQKESSTIGMSEKHAPYEIAKKMRKKDKRKSIFTKSTVAYCTCTGKKKKCNLPRRK